MKKTILATFLVSSLVGFTSCETYDDLFPEYCHKVLNIKNGGERDITLYTTGEDGELTFSVMKTGSEANSSVTGLVASMAEDEYIAYADKYNISNSYLPEEYYTLVDNTLSFSGQEGYKFVKVIFKTNAISELQNKSGKKYAIPLKLTSTDATVNDSLLILKPEIIVPTIGFQNANYQQLYQFDSSGSAQGSFDIPITLPIDNIWDFECTVQVTDAAKEKFNQLNASNNSKYTLMPEGNYKFDNKVLFKNGNSISSLKVNVDKTGLNRGFYVIPLEITSCSKEGFKVNENNKFILAGINYSPDKINLTVDQFSTNSLHEGDGTGLAGLIDGLGAGKHFHSKWSGMVIDADYGNYIDVKLKSPIQSVMFEYWTRFENGNAAPKKIKVFVSNDGKSWNELGSISSGLPNGGNQQYTSKIYTSDSKFNYFRFAVLESTAGSMQVSPGSWFNLGEFALYGN